MTMNKNVVYQHRLQRFYHNYGSLLRTEVNSMVPVHHNYDIFRSLLEDGKSCLNIPRKGFAYTPLKIGSYPPRIFCPTAKEAGRI